MHAAHHRATSCRHRPADAPGRHHAGGPRLRAGGRPAEGWSGATGWPTAPAENTAEHSWHLGIMAMVLAPFASEPIDVGRAVAMALVHDIVEIDAGDTFAYAQMDPAVAAAKVEAEQRAADRLFGLLPPATAAWFRELWDDYEAGGTPEARFVMAVDRSAPMLLNITEGGSAWREHGITREGHRPQRPPRGARHPWAVGRPDGPAGRLVARRDPGGLNVARRRRPPPLVERTAVTSSSTCSRRGATCSSACCTNCGLLLADDPATAPCCAACSRPPTSTWKTPRPSPTTSGSCARIWWRRSWRRSRRSRVPWACGGPMSEGAVMGLMQALNAVRLVLGTLLDVGEEHDPSAVRDDDPMVGEHQLYSFLSWLLEHLVRATMG